MTAKLIGSFFPQSDSSEMSNQDEVPPKWIETLLDRHTERIASYFINYGASSSNEPSVPPAKRQKTQRGAPLPHIPPKPPRDHYDSDDEFDDRFCYLIGPNVNNDGTNVINDGTNVTNDSDSEHSETQERSLDENIEQAGLDSVRNFSQVQSDGEESVDDALVEITDKIPNWEPYSQLKKFIAKCIDRPLPEEMLKHLSDEFVPPADMQEFFIPPKMPSRLYNAISKLKSKNAIRSEKAMYNAQKELFIIAKPLIAALAELKPLGEPVKLAREKLSISIQGLFSSSLKISRARRENVRFLFKFALADVLYGYEPNHRSLFGGSSFASQIESAAKEAKLDLSWAKTTSKPKQNFMPFRNYNPQGFQQNRNFKNYRKSYSRRPFSNNQNSQKSNQFNKTFNKSTRGSSSHGKQQ